MGKPFPLDFRPGIVKVDAPYALRGRYIDCDKVRFNKGKPEKWLGWETFSIDPLTGIPRALKGWDDNSGNRWLSSGTHKKLYIVSTGGVATNVTPIRDSGTLGNNPFSMTNGSAIVTVSDVGHRLIVEATAVYSGAAAAGGITINGEYLVNTVIDADSYTIIHSAAATSTTTGGGAAVTYSYEINPGGENVVFGLGYGTGAYGLGTYGTARTSSSFTVYPLVWSLDTYGENLLAMPSGGFLYQWDPDTPSSAAARVANSPFGNFMFVTNERYPVVLGADGSNMTLAWPDQNDITNWTPGTASTALTRSLQKGSRLVAGANLINTANILWTDESIYTMNYTGARNSVYNTLLAGEKCGLIGPHAFFVVHGTAYWMGQYDFHMYTGSVQQIPNSDDIKDWLYGQLDKRQNWKVAAHYASAHNEIRWNYVAEGDLEPSFYVAVSLDDFSWTPGTLNRTAWAERSGINPVTYATDENGVIFEHEVGLDDDGAAMSCFIESAPMDIEDGDVSMDIWGYIPNFQRQTGDIEVTIQTWDQPNHTNVQETQAETIVEGAGIVDLHLSGRQASVRLDCFQIGGDFRLGVGKVEVSAAGSRRGAA